MRIPSEMNDELRGLSVLTDPSDFPLNDINQARRDALKAAIDLYRRRGRGEEPLPEEWRLARDIA